jgi:hypothetical protein
LGVKNPGRIGLQQMRKVAEFPKSTHSRYPKPENEASKTMEQLAVQIATAL